MGFINGSRYTDNDLQKIPKNTVFLRLENSFISDAGVVAMPQLDQIRCIDFDGCNITNKSLYRVATFHSLEELWLEDTQVNDSGIMLLGKLKSLKYLSVLNTQVSSKVAQHLKKSNPDLLVDYEIE
ncbi:hypothetical protein [Acaryochloris sp. CCMEE 5410]|uniref:hypothetical protein n=1 Tax=Acaryochloris sp. CCMEE 5410 TaxID=310037 RepID=UPI0002484BF0|nr:hypothetical protein [Acaryochloris sp. CCMEE 5410]